MTSVLMLATLSFTPLHRIPAKSAAAKTNICSQLINVDNWKNKKYVVWALAIPSALFGYFVPYVHIVSLDIHCRGSHTGYAHLSDTLYARFFKFMENT
jgi:hypothetical protein